MIKENIIKKLSTIFIICTIGLSALAGSFIYFTSKNMDNTDNINYVYARVTSISIEDTPVKNEKSIITLNGELPNSCWKLEFHEKQVYKNNKLVVIKLWASCYNGPCLEMMYYFHYNVSITFPTSGNWEISCNRISIKIIVLD